MAAKDSTVMSLMVKQRQEKWRRMMKYFVFMKMRASRKILEMLWIHEMHELFEFLEALLNYGYLPKEHK